MRISKIIILIMLFIIANPAHAFDPSIYTPSTIHLEFTRIETDHQSEAGQGSVNILIHPMVPFSIFAEYLGQERELSEDNRRSLIVFAKTFNKPIALDIYKYEILIRDSDNREYWLPIQENFREAFHKEYYHGCKLTLYLLISIIYDHKPLVLINEFWVQ